MVSVSAAADLVLLIVLRLVLELRRNNEDWQKIVKDFALHLSMTPAPLCGSLQLVSSICCATLASLQ